MKRWHLTAGLAATTALAAYLVPTLHADAGIRTSIVPPTPAPPVLPTPQAPDAYAGILKLEARLDQGALLQGSSEDRFVVVEVTAPDLPGDVRRAVHLAVVMDTSGSMAGRGKITSARMAAQELVDQLQPGDTFSLVTFSDRSRTIVQQAPVLDLGATKRLIGSIQPGGGTNLYSGLVEGQQHLQSITDGGVKRVVVLSDGMANIGITDTASLTGTAGSLVGEGISVSALGLGLDFNEDLLAAMSDAGGGAYHFVNRPGQLASLFSTELLQMTKVAGREVVVDVGLPAGVQLVDVYGYDNAVTTDGYRVFMGDIHGGETRKVVARVRLPTDTVGPVDVANVHLSYADADDGRLAVQDKDLDATVTRDSRLVDNSVDTKAGELAGYAVNAQALAESASTYARGNRREAQQRLRDANVVLDQMTTRYGAPALKKVVSENERNLDAYEAAPESDEGLYQIKQAKEDARAYAH